MKKLFLQYGKLMCGEFLEEPCDKEVYTHQKAVWDKMVSTYQAAVSAAKDSAVEADPGHGFYKALLNAEGFSTGEGSDHEVNVAMSFLKEGQLYDLPEGWMVEICCQYKPDPNAANWTNCHVSVYQDYQKEDNKKFGSSRKIARLIPLKEQSSGIVATGIPEYGPLAQEWIGTWPDTVEAGIPESGEDFIQSVENAYMDRITTILIQKWHLDYGTARDVGRDFFYSWILPIYELGGQFGLKPKVSPPPQESHNQLTTDDLCEAARLGHNEAIDKVCEVLIGANEPLATSLSYIIIKLKQPKP